MPPSQYQLLAEPIVTVARERTTKIVLLFLAVYLSTQITFPTAHLIIITAFCISKTLSLAGITTRTNLANVTVHLGIGVCAVCLFAYFLLEGYFVLNCLALCVFLGLSLEGAKQKSQGGSNCKKQSAAKI